MRQRGNARVSFEESATLPGTPVVRQENSYYAFGLTMQTSPVAPPTDKNKQLYNGGSEWQNDYDYLPDLQQTFYRNYDAALGRFVGVDPMAEATESMSVYQYANNNPVMMNDPMGDYATPPGAFGSGFASAQDFRNAYKRAWGETGQEMNEQEARFFGSDVSSSSGIGGGGSSDGIVVYQAGQSGSGLLTKDQIAGFLQSGFSYSENGQLGFYQSVGLGFYNADHSGVTNDQGGYIGNSYNIWNFVPLGGNTVSASQGGDPVGLKDFVAIASGEAAGNRAASRAIGSTMLNRLDAANSDLSDPNWMSASIHIKGLGGTVRGNYQILRTPNQYEYKMVMGMTMSQIRASSLPYIVGALQAYDNRATMDYSNFAISWSATPLSAADKAADNNFNRVNSGIFVITTVAGNSTFFRFK